MVCTAGDAAGAAAAPPVPAAGGACGLAELAGDIQDVLAVEQARHDMDESVLALPDHGGGGAGIGGDQYAWPGADPDLLAGRSRRDWHRQDAGQVTEQLDLPDQIGRDAGPGEHEVLELG